MQIFEKPTRELIKYLGNARKHPKKQIDALTELIKEFGFRFPILLDKDNTIISGHGRLEAAIKIGMETVPCLMAEDLTTEQADALRLADNHIGGLSTWDVKLFNEGLKNLELKIDFGKLNLSEKKSAKNTRLKQNLEGFFKFDFELGQNEFDIPEIQPCNVDMDGVTWFNFNNKEQITDPANTAIHFYIEDYQFNAVWTHPDKYIPLFQQCRAVVTPDFSNYTDMPKVMQMWNHFRRQTLGKYWQDNGVNVICSLSWAYEQIFPWTFAGIPQRTMLAYQQVGHGAADGSGLDELSKVVAELKPSKLYVKVSEKYRTDVKEAAGMDIEVIPPFVFRGEKNGKGK